MDSFTLKFSALIRSRTRPEQIGGSIDQNWLPNSVSNAAQRDFFEKNDGVEYHKDECYCNGAAVSESVD